MKLGCVARTPVIGMSSRSQSPIKARNLETQPRIALFPTLPRI
jgi:hypothetical protein